MFDAETGPRRRSVDTAVSSIDTAALPGEAARVLGAATAADDDETHLTSQQSEATAVTTAGLHVEAADLAGSGRQLAERRGYGRSRGSMLAETQTAALVALGRWRL